MYRLVGMLSAAVLAWSNTSSSAIVPCYGATIFRDASIIASSAEDREMLILQLMPEALCELLSTEPWQQIAGKVSGSRLVAFCLILPSDSNSIAFY